MSALRREHVSRALLLLLVLSLSSLVLSPSASAQGAISSAKAADARLLHAASPFAAEQPGRLARAAAIAGLAGAGLMLGGTLAIELADRPHSERITRGIHLGFTALAAPLVALVGFTTRKRERVASSDALSALGWAFYAGAIGLGVAQWYNAIHHQPPAMGLGFLYGALAVLSLLPHSFDTYLAGRNARMARFLWLGQGKSRVDLILLPGGIAARF